MTEAIAPAPRTADGADLEFLRSATPPHGIIAAGIGTAPREPDMQEAFARAILSGWIALIDLHLGPPQFSGGPPVLQRVFKLTALGQARIAQLRTSAK